MIRLSFGWSTKKKRRNLIATFINVNGSIQLCLCEHTSNTRTQNSSDPEPSAIVSSRPSRNVIERTFNVFAIFIRMCHMRISSIVAAIDQRSQQRTKPNHVLHVSLFLGSLPSVRFGGGRRFSGGDSSAPSLHERSGAPK